jgi:hypothetical protein
MARTLDELEAKLQAALLEVRARDLRWKGGDKGNASVAARDRRELLKRIDDVTADVREMRTKQPRLPGVK